MSHPAPDYTPRHPMMLGVLTQADVENLRTAMQIANHQAACHVAERCCPVRGDDGTRWLDTRPMLDPRECPGASIDMAAMYLQYLESTGLATRHPQQRHLVRLQWPAAPLAG